MRIALADADEAVIEPHALFLFVGHQADMLKSDNRLTAYRADFGVGQGAALGDLGGLACKTAIFGHEQNLL